MGLIAGVLHRLFPPRPEPVVSMRPGQLVLARGRVVPRDVITSPLTGTACVYYRHMVEELRPSAVPLGENAGIWILVGRDEAIAEFYLDDGSGRALILPEGAEITGGGAGVPVAVPSGQRAREIAFGAGALVEIHGVVDEIEDLLDENRGYRERAARVALRAPEGEALKIRIVQA